MVVISTFVIFDIETTGLPRFERNQTKITELTFLAVDRRDIESAILGQAPYKNKLSYLFNPQRIIQSEVCELTGLTNEVLKNQPIFKRRTQRLNSFLEGLPKPVCLVAHNGNSFDFKLLRSEYIDAGAALPEDLLCVDSLWGFRKILKETNLTYEILVGANASKSDDDLLTDDEDTAKSDSSADELDIVGKLFSMLSENNCLNSNKAAPVFEKKPPSVKICCTLQALYKRLLNKDAVNAHRSEADCLMLLECIVAIKDQFLPYADFKCKLISEVKPFQRY